MEASSTAIDEAASPDELTYLEELPPAEELKAIALSPQMRKARRLVAAFFLLTATCTGLVLDDLYTSIYPAPPPYIVFGSGVETHRVRGRPGPVLDRNDVTTWATKWLTAPYNVDYFNYQNQILESETHYTSEGWSDFIDAYRKIGNLELLTTARLTCYAQPMRDAVIAQTDMFAGRTSFNIQIPIVQTCENVNEQHTQNLMITAKVIGVANLRHPDGLAIDRIVTKVK